MRRATQQPSRPSSKCCKSACGLGQPLIVLGHVGKLNVRVDIDENDIGRVMVSKP